MYHPLTVRIQHAITTSDIRHTLSLSLVSTASPEKDIHLSGDKEMITSEAAQLQEETKAPSLDETSLPKQQEQSTGGGGGGEYSV